MCSSRAPFKSNDSSAGAGWGRRGRLGNCFPCLSQGLRGNPGAAAPGLSGRSPPPTPPARPLRHPLPAAAPAPRGRKRRAPPTLSRSLASPVRALSEGREEGGGAEGIAAMERRKNPARARQAVESHGHIKMPY